jgi:hypothetical protein
MGLNPQAKRREMTLADTARSTVLAHREGRRSRIAKATTGTTLEQRVERARQAARRPGPKGTTISSRIRAHLPKNS